MEAQGTFNSGDLHVLARMSTRKVDRYTHVRYGCWRRMALEDGKLDAFGRGGPLPLRA